tara:strand:- start:2274 stop:2537 length:264 start_codon:yes stop_codon:yes gene_type:complete
MNNNIDVFRSEPSNADIDVVEDAMTFVSMLKLFADREYRSSDWVLELYLDRHPGRPLTEAQYYSVETATVLTSQFLQRIAVREKLYD